jgi:hypothetical protein
MFRPIFYRVQLSGAADKKNELPRDSKEQVLLQ